MNPKLTSAQLYYLCQSWPFEALQTKSSPSSSPSTSVPPSCVLTSLVLLSFPSLAGPDSSNRRELPALLQRVCQLQC